MPQYLLAIDQGTTSSRAIVFTPSGDIVSVSQREFTQYFPKNGWVEHDPEEIWESVYQTCREALEQKSIASSEIVAIGISNQRETTLVWDKNTGKTIYPAIVWQDRRTANYCEELINNDQQTQVQEKTGLLLDPYFSATKVKWILDHVEGARVCAEKGELLFGTVDSFLIWRLTDGQVHATDATNASRTLLFNIHTQTWDEELLALFDVPATMLPEVLDCSADFGKVHDGLFETEIPIAGVAGDQQAAVFGQACFKPGMVKSTYGTGCFVLLNTGKEVIQSKNRLLSTIAYRIQGEVSYAVEGSIFIAGAAVQWLRDTAHLVGSAKDTEAIAASIENNGGVYLVPAFTGLGAPYWDPQARGAILGLTRDSGAAHIIRAALEAVCYQTRDLLEAMIKDGAAKPSELRVDGGMVANNWLVQFLSDILQVSIERPKVIETSALGVAYLAGLQVGIYKSLDEISQMWQCNQSWQPNMPDEDCQRFYQGWLKAVRRIL